MAKDMTITLLLLDGDLSGRIECSLSNWSGYVYKIPKDKLEQSKSLEYIEEAGVYFLFGKNKDNAPAVYVGQAVIRQNGNGLLSRIQEPHRSISWTDAVLFTSTDNTLGPTEVSYLEYHFYQLAKKAESYQICNSNTPNPVKVTKQIKIKMDAFIDYAKIVMPTLGYKVFEIIPPIPDPLRFHMKYGSGEANGKPTDDGKFVIFKGSTINPETTKSCPKNVLRARSEHADKINDAYELISDILMTSPSAAAGFIAGTALNGNQVWRDSKGNSLNQSDEK